MNPLIRPAPVRRSITVRSAPEKAFDVFTLGIGRWWPKTHSVGGAPQRDVVLEPEVGGRWFEISEGGAECEWGRVLVWEPPKRVVLAWQLGADWKYDPALVTEVEIRFTPETGGGTRVDLEHRHLERFGDRAEEVRGMIDSEGGWAGILRLFAAVADD